MFKPTAYGSSGCPGSKSGGHGGGILLINIGGHFQLDGLLESSGQPASAGSNAGGGSGGSILVYTERFSGHGVIRVDGGNGDGVNGGGGAGGRIALYTSSQRIAFVGHYSATGNFRSFLKSHFTFDTF